MLFGGVADGGGLELRRAGNGGARLSGRFPYNRAAVLSDGGKTGRPRKEVMASRAFAFRVDDPKAEIHILVGHSYDRPLASRGAGTLTLKDSADALTFEATISPEMSEVGYVRDFLAGLAAGLITGVSPGFRIPPERAVANAESVAEEDPKLGLALIRTIHSALLYELSMVTVPAYPEAQVEARNWQPDHQPEAGLHRTFQRWRA